MTQSLDLNKMGLTPMNEFEMMEVEGGFHFYYHIPWAVHYAAAKTATHAAADFARGMFDELFK